MASIIESCFSDISSLTGNLGVYTGFTLIRIPFGLSITDLRKLKTLGWM